jgi:two-component system, LuxR family, response regulator FixJ
MTGSELLVAVLDDEAKMRAALARLLRVHGCQVELFESGSEFFSRRGATRADCLLLDLNMPETTGFDVLRTLAAERSLLPVIVITGHDEPGNAERVRSLGAAGYLLKPVDEAELFETIHRVRGDPPGKGAKYP